MRAIKRVDGQMREWTWGRRLKATNVELESEPGPPRQSLTCPPPVTSPSYLFASRSACLPSPFSLAHSSPGPLSARARSERSRRHSVLGRLRRRPLSQSTPRSARHPRPSPRRWTVLCLARPTVRTSVHEGVSVDGGGCDGGLFMSGRGRPS